MARNRDALKALKRGEERDGARRVIIARMPRLVMDVR